MRIDWRTLSLEDAERLSAGGAAHDCARPVPGTRWLVHRMRGGAGSGLVLTDRRGRLAHPLVLDGGEYGPPWPAPDGSHCVFAWRADPEARWQLRGVRLPGGEVSIMMQAPDAGYRDPSFGADGSTLLYSSDEGSTGTWQLWEADPGKGERRPLSSGPRGGEEPAESPSGRKVAFSARPEGEPHRELFLFDRATLETRRLTAAPADSAGPVWLDEHRILFTRTLDGGEPGVMLVDTLRCREKWLTAAGEGCRGPWPCPGRGKRIRVLYSQPDPGLTYDVESGVDVFRAELAGALAEDPDREP